MATARNDTSLEDSGLEIALQQSISCVGGTMIVLLDSCGMGVIHIKVEESARMVDGSLWKGEEASHAGIQA